MKLPFLGKSSPFTSPIFTGVMPPRPRRRWKAVVSLCLAGAWVPILCAQQASPAPDSPAPLPPGPLLERAPDFAQWTITSKAAVAPTNAQTAPAATPAPNGSVQKPATAPTDATTTVVKTKDIRLVQTVTAGGSKTQKWCFPDMQLIARGRGTPTVFLTGGGTHAADYVDYSKSDFADLGWITAKNYTGVTQMLGQDCLIFKDKVKVDADGSGGFTVSAVACIAKDGRLPVALQFGDEIRTYQFGPPPTDMLAPPPEINKVLDKWRKSLRQASLPPTKP